MSALAERGELDPGGGTGGLPGEMELDPSQDGGNGQSLQLDTKSTARENGSSERGYVRHRGRGKVWRLHPQSYGTLIQEKPWAPPSHPEVIPVLSKGAG